MGPLAKLVHTIAKFDPSFEREALSIPMDIKRKEINLTFIQNSLDGIIDLYTAIVLEQPATFRNEASNAAPSNESVT